MTKCFQISKLFSNLTVYENVQIARIEMNKRLSASCRYGMPT